MHMQGKRFARTTRAGRRRLAAVLTAAALLTGGLSALGLAPAAQADASLAGHWPMDEGSGTSAADASGAGNTATLGSGASWTAGQVGDHAVRFDGTANGTADIPAPVVDTSKSFTVSAWVKLDSTSGYQTAVSIDGAQLSGFYLQLSGVTGSFAFTRRTADSSDSAEVRADSPVKPAAGTWYHLVGVDDTATGSLKVYVDGSQGTDGAFTTAWKADGHTEIGRGKFGGAAVDFMHGAVDDVRFYQGALSSGEIQALDTGAHWAYDEGSGTSAADSSGNGHTAALDSDAGWTAGKAGAGALALSGTAHSRATAHGPVVDTGKSFSVAAWVKLDDTAGYQTFVSGDSGQVSSYYLQLRGDTGRFAFTRLASDSTSAAASTASAATAPKAGTWYHLLGVDDTGSGRLLLYVNGVLAGSTPYTTPWTSTGDTVTGAGYYGAPADFTRGTVDDVHLLGYALPPDLLSGVAGNLGGTLDVGAGTALHPMPSTFFGLMTEDINHSMTGGLYPELINNRSMKADPAQPADWSATGDAAVSLDATHPLNSALDRSLELTVNSASRTARAGVANGGYWGIPVRPGERYTVSFFAEADPGFSGRLTADIESSDGKTVYAGGHSNGVTTKWRQYTFTMTAGARVPTTSDARFVLSTDSAHNRGKHLWLDNVSVFPPTYGNVANGLRTDLMQKFSAMKPAFIREPGGNYLEGNTLSTRFDWKKTIGPVWTRPGHQDDAWGYFSTDGMGLLEYLEWCEQLGAKPLLAVYAGYSLNGSVVPLDGLGPYIQDALDEIQYATGPVTSKWGAQRAKDGHPAPFAIDYVEVGNEDWLDRSGTYSGANGRFAQFSNAIKAAYPKMKTVATTAVSGATPDVVDDHYYQSPSWMQANSNRYDDAPRTGPKVMVGEWATREGSAPTPDMNAALGDASWLTGLIRNSDLVTQEAYAPMLVNVHDVAWSTDLIGFDALTSYGSPSYYVQTMLAGHSGDQVLAASYAGMGDIHTVATRDSRTGRVYLTIVNPGNAAQPVTVNLDGAGKVPANGTATVLSSAHATDTNTITDPRKIVPVTRKATGLGSTFTRTVPAYSVTVLTLG